MATLEEVTATVTSLTTTIGAIDTKLDEIRTFIQGLQVGSPVTQEQFDALAAMVGAAKDSAESVLAETDALDNP